MIKDKCQGSFLRGSFEEMTEHVQYHMVQVKIQHQNVKRYCVQVQDSADAILVLQVMRVRESWKIDRLVKGL